MNEFDKSWLQDKRYICLVRCSTNEQEDTSIPDQLRVLHDFAQKHGMIHAGDDKEFQLGGVSGSNPGARMDIEQIIDRKRTRNDFDVLLILDISRLTRGGVEHGGKIEFDLAAAGIKIVFASGQLPEGEYAGIIKSVGYYAAQEFAKNVSAAVARGQMSAISQGRQAYCLRPPFAVDRLYVSLDGKPLHIVRNLCNGTQQRLDPKTLAILQTYPKPIKGQPPVRCRKQAGEHIDLIPGAPVYVETVRRMFKRLLIDGWGDWRIAKELNDLGIPSPNGKRWTRRGVLVILRNPIYIGIGIANQRSNARFHERSVNSPRKLPYDLTEVAQRKKPAVRRRPSSEWLEQRHAELEGFLGPELRDLAIAYRSRVLTAAASPPTVRKDKHVDSTFFLKGILCSKQGGYPMSGRTQGPADYRTRYYHVSRSDAFPSSDKTMRRNVRAEPMERAVLQAVRETLLHANLREQIAGTIKREAAKSVADERILDQLRQERDQIRGQIEFVIDEFGSLGKEAAKVKIKQLEARLASLNERMAQAAAPRQTAKDQINLNADEIVERLRKIAESLDQMPKHALRQLIATLVVRLEVDLETKALEMEIALPSEVFSAINRAEAHLGLGENFLQRTIAKAQLPQATVIAIFECDQPSRDCYDCRRVRRAA